MPKILTAVLLIFLSIAWGIGTWISIQTDLFAQAEVKWIVGLSAAAIAVGWGRFT